MYQCPKAQAALWQAQNLELAAGSCRVQTSLAKSVVAGLGAKVPGALAGGRADRVSGDLVAADTQLQTVSQLMADKAKECDTAAQKARANAAIWEAEYQEHRRGSRAYTLLERLDIARGEFDQHRHDVLRACLGARPPVADACSSGPGSGLDHR